MKKIILLSVVVVVMLSSCRTDPGYARRAVTPKYNAGDLAEKWRERYLKNRAQPSYPGGTSAYPYDNDRDYYYPYQGYGGNPYVPPSPRYYPQPYAPSPYYGNPYQPHQPLDFDGSNQYSYPYYDPSADNGPYGGTQDAESYDYPIYFDDSGG